MRGWSWTHSRTCSWIHSQSHSRSHSRSRSRSHSRAHGQSHPWSGSQSRQPRSPNGPPPGRRVTFREPEVEPTLWRKHGGLLIRTLCFRCGDMARVESLTTGHASMVVRAQCHSRGEGPQKLTRKIWASFYIPKVRMRDFLKQEYTAPPAPNASTETPSFQMNCHTKTYGNNQFS